MKIPNAISATRSLQTAPTLVWLVAMSALASLLFTSEPAQAALVVNRSIITFDNPTVTREDVVVINSSEEQNLYVQVEPFEVHRPGFADQELVPLRPGDDPDFLVTPNRLITAPGGRSIVRFLNLREPDDSERVYRVNMTPVTPPPEVTGQSDTVTSRLEVVVAYQILVIVLPADPDPVMEFSRAGDTVVFENPGNANYLLTDGEQCNPEDPQECITLEDHRMYPGNRWEKELPFDGPFTYNVRTHDGITSEYFE